MSSGELAREGESVVKVTGNIVGLPFSIRDATGKLCYSGALPDANITLPHGSYFVNSYGLDGSPTSQVFEVLENQKSAEVLIGQDLTEELLRAAEAGTPKTLSDKFPNTAIESAGSILLEQMPFSQQRNEHASFQLQVRYYKPGPCGQFNRFGSVQTVAHREFVDPPQVPNSLCVLVEVLPPNRLVAPDSFFCMVPTDGMYRVVVEESVVGVETQLRKDSARIQTAMMLFGAGQKQIASKIISSQDAEAMLAGKVQDPISAAAAAYILLSTGQAKKREQWILNLHSWFPSLSDGTIIAAEIAARGGDLDAANQLLRELSDRPFPLFLEGYSLAVSRTRQSRHLVDAEFDVILGAYQGRSQAIDYSSALLAWRHTEQP